MSREAVYYRSYETPNAEGGVFPIFYKEPIQNEAKSLDAGRPIFDEVEMVEINFAGDSTKTVIKRVTPEIVDRWPRSYDAFKRGQTQETVNGTPLEAWTALGRAQVKEMQALNIHTVEQLASLNDNAIARFGIGGRMWVERAKAFLDAAEDNAAVDKLAAENAALKEQNEALGRQIAELAAAVRQIQGAPAAPSEPLPPAVAAPVPVDGALGEAGGYVAPKRRARKDEAA